MVESRILGFSEGFGGGKRANTEGRYTCFRLTRRDGSLGLFENHKCPPVFDLAPKGKVKIVLDVPKYMSYNNVRHI